MTAPTRSPMSRLLGAALVALLLSLTVRVSDATVAEQRARLPPAAECEHPVEGKWKAVVYREGYEVWHEFILEVHPVAGKEGALTGTIYVDTWNGGPGKSEPGACEGRRFKGIMDGSGSFKGGRIAFGGGPFRLTEVLCGERQAIAYAPDQFTGMVEPERQEFQAVNNDGATAVNEPAVFRRIACFDDAPVGAAAKADVKPPPFFPARREGGCVGSSR
jgi:hypothetical protein